MFYQISPVRPQARKAAGAALAEEPEIENLVLAPFTPTPKLSFDNIKVGTTFTHRICMSNPTTADIKLYIENGLAKERNVVFNWAEQIVPAQGQQLLEITWMPIVAGTWRDVLHVTDKKRLKRDIHIVFKSFKPAVTKKTVKRKKIKSPERINQNSASIPSLLVQNVDVGINRRETFKVINKENFCPQPPANGTYTLNAEPMSENFDDSLEMQEERQIAHTPLLSSHTPLMASNSNVPLCTPNWQQTSFVCSTGEKSHPGSDLRNISGGTYVKTLNVSAETYVLSKHNVSGGTYVKDSSVGNLADLQFSPLQNIVEETSFRTTPMKPKPTARKTLSYTRKSPVKRLLSGSTRQSLSLKKFLQPTLTSKPVTKTTIVKQIACFNDVCNPYVLAHTSGVDPFIAATQYYSPQWVDEQIRRFSNWMNLLLVPPADMDCKTVHVDIAKVWQACRAKETIAKAPSKEAESIKLDQASRLQSLRRKAMNLYRCPEMISVLSKCSGLVMASKFVMRADKNLHQDVGLQKEILRLLFCYNPLWLRIGLETVYNLHICLRASADLPGITRFLMEHFFNSKYLLRKYKNKCAPGYITEIKRQAIIRFLHLVYFLDQAKIQKIIAYDPCLFVKTAPYKESHELLLRFTSELFSSIGDVTKPLRAISYTLAHKQSYIHEFEYGVENLGADLKDGVRLTRVMEIILLEPNLTEQLRVPAHSRLQKIHNVKVSFDALQRAGYTIRGEIEPKDIVAGHREKTLSFLWQIIDTFHSPRFVRSVIVVQQWWRSAPVQQRLLESRQRQAAARRIQGWYRHLKTRARVQMLTRLVEKVCANARQEKAATRIVCCWRRYVARRDYLKLKAAVKMVEDSYKSRLEMRLCRERYIRLKESCVFVQRTWRALRIMRPQREEYQRVRRATCLLQAKWRATLQMRSDLYAYCNLQIAAVIIQRRFRAQRLMLQTRDDFVTKRNAAIRIQRYYRGHLETASLRQAFLNTQNACLKIQICYRGVQLMRAEMQRLHRLRETTIFIQRKYRAMITMRKDRAHYLLLQETAMKVQRRFRAKLSMRRDTLEYQKLRWAAQTIQRRWRALKLTRALAANYSRLKAAVRIIERHYFARRERANYLRFRQIVVMIQSRFRARKLGQATRHNYLQLKKAVETVEKYREGKAIRKNYLQMQRAAVFIQTKYRAKTLMINQRNAFVVMRKAVVTIQTAYRCRKLMRKEMELKEVKINLIIAIQRRWRAHQSRQRAAVILQRRYRARLQMLRDRAHYLRLRDSAIVLQRRWNASQSMHIQRAKYRIARQAIQKIQEFYRNTIAMRYQRHNYLRMQHSARVIQSSYRAMVLMRRERIHYLRSKELIIRVQRRFRANILMRQQRDEYCRLKNAVCYIQATYRGNKQRNNFLRMKSAVRVIETRYKAKLLSIQCETNYKELKTATIFVQRRYREKLEQRKIRALQKQAVGKIEAWYLSLLQMRRDRRHYQSVKRIVVNLQRRFRATQCMRNQRRDYLRIQTASKLIQTFYRGYKSTQREIMIRRIKLEVILRIQAQIRGLLIRQKYAEYKTPAARAARQLEANQEQAATRLQSVWRGYTVRRSQSRKLAEIRARMLAATQTATEDKTLKQCTKRNLRVILLGGTASVCQVTNALLELDRATRLCRSSCVFIAQHARGDLYHYIVDPNSSYTGMLITSAAAGVLLNLVKCRTTIEFVWMADKLEAFIRAMLRTCDKENDVFVKLATILWVFGNWDRMHYEVIVALPAFRDQMRKMLMLCERQQKMVSRAYSRRKPSVFADYGELPLPLLNSNWGLDYRHAPNAFVNAVHAIRTCCLFFNCTS